MTQELSSVQTALAIRSKKLSCVRTARAFRSKQLSVALLFQIPFTQAICDEPVKKCIYNSSKRRLPSPHEFSWYIFCWLAFFAFITFDYRYKFYSRLSYNIQQISRTSYVLTFSHEKIKRFWKPWEYTLAVNKLYLFKISSSSFTVSGKTIKSYCYGTDLKNKNGSLHVHGGLEKVLINQNAPFREARFQN